MIRHGEPSRSSSTMPSSANAGESQVEAEFAERMYVYHYRLFDRYRRRVASLAILGDERPKWRPDSFGYELGLRNQARISSYQAVRL